MMFNPDTKIKNKGFSFVEVLVAMVILSISLVVLINAQARSLDLVGRTRSLDKATTLAISKMTELLEEVKQKGLGTLRDEENGEFDQAKHPDFRWRYWKVAVPAPDFGAMLNAVAGTSEEDASNQGNAALLAGPLKMIAKAWGEGLRELHVEVKWGTGKNERSYELVTHLIAQDAISQVQGLIGSLGGGGQQDAQGQQNTQNQKAPQSQQQRGGPLQ